MMTLSEFARTLGAKDEQPRKKRNVMGYLGAGSVLGVGGVEGSKYFAKKHGESAINALTELGDRNTKSIIKGKIPDNKMQEEWAKEIGKKHKVFRNRNLAYGALGLGALGTGLMAKGVYNAIKNRQEGKM